MKLTDRPELRNPIFMAAWPGMGLVAHRTVSYLIEKLGPRQLGVIEPGDRFPLRAVTIDDGLVRSASLPEGGLHVLTGAGSRDILLFLGDEQPVAGKEWTLANELLALTEQLGARLLYTFAAIPSRIDHHKQPSVWGVATDRMLLQQLEEHDVKILEEGSISGLNGVLLGVAKRRGWDGFCLLGEIPLYATQLENPKSCLAVLERVCGMTGLQVELDELRVHGDVAATQLDLIFQQISKEADSDNEPEPALDDDDKPILN